MSDHTPKTDAQIKELAMEMLAGRFYSDRDVPKALVPQVFLPLALMGQAELDKLMAFSPALVYAILGKDKTTGITINGMPSFASCNFLTQDEVDRLVDTYDKLKQAVKDV